ncbi:MAG: threonine--tRNA ligase, partial [Pseudomonadota bacterium]
RVRGFTQDDGHIFCRMDQVMSESKKFISFLAKVYADLGFDNWTVKLSTRPEKRIGSDETWDILEQSLGDACRAAGHEYALLPGEGAFYGPKLEFTLTDAIGRDWQCGTLQVDTNMPERLGASYIGQDGDKHTPVMLHRACLGSFERFIGILIEEHAGKLPFWLAPRQVVVAAIVSDADDFVHKIVADLRAAGVRAEADVRNEKINYKVREHSVGKVPVILAIGMREVEEGTVSMRRLGEKQSRSLTLEAAVAELSLEATPPDLLERRERAMAR